MRFVHDTGYKKRRIFILNFAIGKFAEFEFPFIIRFFANVSMIPYTIKIQKLDESLTCDTTSSHLVSEDLDLVGSVPPPESFLRVKAVDGR